MRVLSVVPSDISHKPGVSLACSHLVQANRPSGLADRFVESQMRVSSSVEWKV